VLVGLYIRIFVWNSRHIFALMRGLIGRKGTIYSIKGANGPNWKGKYDGKLVMKMRKKWGGGEEKTNLEKATTFCCFNCTAQDLNKDGKWSKKETGGRCKKRENCGRIKGVKFAWLCRAQNLLLIQKWKIGIGMFFAPKILQKWRTKREWKWRVFYWQMQKGEYVKKYEK
jgi:hypothetical protein